MFALFFYLYAHIFAQCLPPAKPSFATRGHTIHIHNPILSMYKLHTNHQKLEENVIDHLTLNQDGVLEQHGFLYVTSLSCQSSPYFSLLALGDLCEVLLCLSAQIKYTYDII